MPKPKAIPTDLTGFGDVPFDEIRPLLDALAADPAPKPVRRVRALLLDRALRLLQQGSRGQISDEAYRLNRFLASAGGKSLEDQAPQLYGGLTAIARLLSGAAERSDRAAVDSILRNHKGRGKQVLEALAAHGEAMPRSQLRAQTKLSESYLSHVLRELEEADLILRFRPEKGREVLVDLGPAGREVVERAVLPSWIRHFVDHREALAKGECDSTRLVEELLELGAPSRTAAARLAELPALGPSPPAPAFAPTGDWLIEQMQQKRPMAHFSRR